MTSLRTFIFFLLSLCPLFASPQIKRSDITVEGDLGSFEKSIATKELESGLEIVTVTLKSPEAAAPPKFSIKWNAPSIDMYAHWTTSTNKLRTNHYYSNVTSGITKGAPVISYFNQADENRITFAASDALNTLKLSAGLREEDSLFYYTVEGFSSPSKAITDYSIDIRIDTRAIPYSQALAETAKWWETDYPSASVPAPARTPMYSTWYNFHQQLEPELLLSELAIAKKIGFDSVIIDDGWQTLDNARGYKFTGDWKPERLKDMKGLVEKIHALDVKVLLWYSLPFVGVGAENYPRFEGKYLRNFGGPDNAYVLDPRYPECREFIISTYEKALQDWNLDGFKLDFIGWFSATKDTKLTAEDGRDFASVNVATQHLMTEIMNRLRKIKSDVMIEFRQPYTGPIMRTYGNMLRGVDCPNDAAANRREIADLRLISGETAVHSDMLMWHPTEPVEIAARQILATLYSVPQISVLLTKYPKEHLDMVTFWTSYWNANQSALLDGELTAHGPAENYPVLEAASATKRIITAYSSSFLQISEINQILDVINATGGTHIALKLQKAAGNVSISIKDTNGKEVKQELVHIDAGITEFTIPPSGVLSIRKSFH